MTQPSPEREVPFVAMRSRHSLGWAVLSLLLVGCTASGDRHELTRATVPAAADPTARIAGGQGAWSRIAPPPIPPPGGMAAAWTGRQLVVWGGQAAEAHGAGTVGRGRPTTRRPTGGRYCRRRRSPPGSGPARCGPDGRCCSGAGRAGRDATFADGAAYDPDDPAVAGAAGGTDRGPDEPPGRLDRQGDDRVGRVPAVLPDRQRDPRPCGGRLRPGHRTSGGGSPTCPPPWSGDDGTAVTWPTATGRWSGATVTSPRSTPPPTPGARCPGCSPRRLPSDPALPIHHRRSVRHRRLGRREVFTWTGSSGELHGSGVAPVGRRPGGGRPPSTARAGGRRSPPAGPG